MESSSSTTNANTVLAPSDDLLYEVVDGQVVELAPMGAYEIRIASVLLMYLETFARQRAIVKSCVCKAHAASCSTQSPSLKVLPCRTSGK